jgi:hypothetical protein
VTDTNPGQPTGDKHDYDENEIAVAFDFDITIAGGEHGHLLAQLQANSILEVIEWFSRRPSTPWPVDSTPPPADCRAG